ncbi:MAG TPA: YncE family protein, partial [Thermoplasmata archaeon]|nr:YncE family protein [Thermoplasmata archaeon]
MARLSKPTVLETRSLRPAAQHMGQLGLAVFVVLLVGTGFTVGNTIAPQAGQPSAPVNGGVGGILSALSDSVRAHTSTESPLFAGWHPASGVANPLQISYHLFSVSRLTGACSTYIYQPAWMAYDSKDGSVWVAGPSPCVERIQPAVTGYSWNITASAAVGSDPFGVAYDNATDDVFVTNTGSNNVSVISAATNASVGSIGVGYQPYGIAYDWATKELYVANGGSANVSVISGSNLSVITSIPVGGDPIGVAVDPASGQVFVANHGSNNVSILSDTSHKVVKAIATGTGPYGVALDNRTDTIYVTNNGSQNVSVINATTNTLVTSIGVGSPSWVTVTPELEGIAYDPQTNLVWLGAGWAYAAVIDPTQQVVVGYAGTDPSGVLYDPANGDICLTNTGNATFECVAFTGYVLGDPLTFHETGLPGGYSWNVTVTSNYYYPQVITRSSTSQNITVRLLAGGVSSYVVSYSVAPPLGYSAVPSHGTVNYTATSNTTGPIVVNITISVIPNTYVLSFDETGLPSGTDWTAVLNGTYNHSVSPSNSFRVPNGSYSYSIGQAGQYVPHPSSGLVNVSGAAVAVPITFSLPPEYPVVFNETGLPSGTQWYVWLGGASVSGNSTSLRFNMTNGTYAYVASATGYYSSGAIGNLTVAGTGVTVVVPFVAAPYTVTFQEVGLPNGTYFTVFLNGSGQSGVHAVAFSVPNGTYHYSVYPVPHYSP